MFAIRRIVVVALVLMLLVTHSLSALENSVFVNDDNVRLREKPTTQSQILANLTKGTAVELIGTQSSIDPKLADFMWVKVKVAGKTGWVYGEYLDSSPNGKNAIANQVENLSDVRIYRDGKATSVNIGDKSNQVLAAFGEPTKRSTEDFEETWTYPELVLIINTKLGRLQHAIFLTEQATLAGRIHIGSEFFTIENWRDFTTIDGGTWTKEIRVGFRAGFYQQGLIVTINKDSKTITKMQIGTPEP